MLRKLTILLMLVTLGSGLLLAQGKTRRKQSKSKATKESETKADTKTEAPRPMTSIPDLAGLQKMMARFAPVEMKSDLSGLSDGDKKALVKLIEAARVLDGVFMNQYWSQDWALYQRLQRDTTP